MGGIQGYLEKLGSNFMVAAFIPSLAFVTACVLTFKSLFPHDFINNIQSAFSPLNQNGFIVLLLATMMGFVLTSLNTYIYKLFEGYVWTDYLKPLRNLELTRARKIRYQRDLIKRKIERVEKWKDDWKRANMPAYQQDKLRRIEKQLQQLRNKRDALATDYDMRYPPKDTMILPSRLGNILRAAEAYPQDRYSADSVALWPRMVWAIDKEYMGHVDAANDQCSFLLKLLLTFGNLCFVGNRGFTLCLVLSRKLLY